MLSQTYYIDHIENILLFSLIGFSLNWIAVQKKFYKLPLPLSDFQTKLSLIHLITCFFIYLASSFFLTKSIAGFLYRHSFSNLSAGVWAQFLSSISAILLLLGCCLTMGKKSLQQIWKAQNTDSYIKDCLLGATTWILAVPITVIVEQAADMIVYALFGLESYEQEAVRYLKAALQSPSQLTAALLLILGTAPVIEEFLFRGLLQTWAKKHLGVKAGILIASMGFALFHISPSHGAGNISLVPSLFAFSCFLGFIYEKQQSLYASISLHIVFNAVTTLRILFSDTY